MNNVPFPVEQQVALNSYMDARRDLMTFDAKSFTNDLDVEPAMAVISSRIRQAFLRCLDVGISNKAILLIGNYLSKLDKAGVDEVLFIWNGNIFAISQNACKDERDVVGLFRPYHEGYYLKIEYSITDPYEVVQVSRSPVTNPKVVFNATFVSAVS